MRVGQNPAKFMGDVARPASVTIAVISYIPFLGGYYSESLEVLKSCLESIWQNTDLPYDLMVFDNASCQEVRSYLLEAQNQGRIQYLILSEKNIGKGGAWNHIFASAPGEFIAYTDSDVYFHSGWLPAQLKLFETFPNLGMLTGAPLRIPEEFSTSTIQWADNEPDVRVLRGKILSWEDWWKHARSLGVTTEPEGKKLYAANDDVVIQHDGASYYVGAAHFQFVARKAVLKSVLPIPSHRPMGQVRTLDILINEKGYLRLSTPEWWVEHLGNTQALELNSSDGDASAPTSKKGFLHLPVVRRFLLRVHNAIFKLYYRS